MVRMREVVGCMKVGDRTSYEYEDTFTDRRHDLAVDGNSRREDALNYS